MGVRGSVCCRDEFPVGDIVMNETGLPEIRA